MRFGKVFIITSLVLVGIFAVSTNILALEAIWPASPNGIDLNAIDKAHEADSSNPPVQLSDLIAYLYGWMITVGGLLAFIIIVIAGFQYLTSGGNPGKIQEAKDKIFSAVTGLLLLLSVVIILNVLNPELTNLKDPQVTFDPGAIGVVEFASPSLSCKDSIMYPFKNQRGSLIHNMDSPSTWTAPGGVTLTSDTDIPDDITRSYVHRPYTGTSTKIAVLDTVTAGATIDFPLNPSSSYNLTDGIMFWIKSDTTGEFIALELHNASEPPSIYPINIEVANDWERYRWDISDIVAGTTARNHITSIKFSITDPSGGPTFLIDEIREGGKNLPPGTGTTEIFKTYGYNPQSVTVSSGCSVEVYEEENCLALSRDVAAGAFSSLGSINFVDSDVDEDIECIINKVLIP